MAKGLSEISKFVASYWNYYLELEEAFKQTQKYVAFDRHNDRTYSVEYLNCLLYTSPSPRDRTRSRMPSSA